MDAPSSAAWAASSTSCTASGASGPFESFFPSRPMRTRRTYAQQHLNNHARTTGRETHLESVRGAAAGVRALSTRGSAHRARGGVA
ncbi:hypothetical protein CALVIDRAFT_534919 [Calocera viscosa TUFC12733]|uniref:Uncharacterized protein n=1 Tax=Calocera viscosa (strain TUFC12733) TaxID=1330018 RepID=A0A167PIR2_CALVF|nr:hypothetical protein CALVIDRAFT_534919 [Calocera viscosa TUFC12733]